MKYKPGIFDDLNAQHEGLKAARILVRLVESYVQDGHISLREVAIDFDGGTVEFTPQQFIELASSAVGTAIAVLRQGAGHQGGDQDHERPGV